MNLYLCMCNHSVMSDSVTLWMVACRPPLSMGSFRQEYWTELPFSSSRGSSWPRNQPWVSCVSSIAVRFFTHWAIRETLLYLIGRHFSYILIFTDSGYKLKAAKSEFNQMVWFYLYFINFAFNRMTLIPLSKEKKKIRYWILNTLLTSHGYLLTQWGQDGLLKSGHLVKISILLF